MRLPPVDVLLSWPTPNYKNPTTRGPALVIVNSICISLVIIIVGLRLYTRIVIKRWFGIDDVFILLALAFTIGLTAVVLLANQRYGWDRHVWDIEFPNFVPASKIAMVAKIVFTAAATFTRLSLHCFYYRLVVDSDKKWFKWLVHGNVAYTIGIFISYTFIAIFQCNPVSDYWNITTSAHSCMDEAKATLICGIINCVADLITTVTPMPLVMQLHMPRRQRFAVAVLFGLGIIVTAAGVVRTWYIYRSLFNEYDQTWYAYPLWIAAAIEIDLGVICASAPVLRPLLAKIPFSFSDTFSRAASWKKSSGYPSNSRTPLTNSENPGAVSASSSKRRSEAIKNVPELSNDKGRSYEMKHWDEAERRIMEDDVERGSQEGIIENDSEGSSKGITRVWDKIKKRASRADMNDMTITKTSEVELQIETASAAQSRRASRHPPHRDPNELTLVPDPLAQSPTTQYR